MKRTLLCGLCALVLVVSCRTDDEESVLTGDRAPDPLQPPLAEGVGDHRGVDGRDGMAALDRNVRCQPEGEHYQIVRVNDDQPLGEPSSLEDCELAVRNSEQGAVCTLNSGSWLPTAIESGRTFGAGLALITCVQATHAAHSGVVCAVTNGSPGGGNVWKAVNMELDIRLGRYPIPQEDCFESTRHARNGVVCSHTGLRPSGRLGFKPTNITRAGDGGFMGSSAWLQYCKVATLHSEPDRVCANGNGGTGNHNGWYQHSISRMSIVSGGRRGNVYQCSGVDEG